MSGVPSINKLIVLPGAATPAISPEPSGSTLTISKVGDKSLISCSFNVFLFSEELEIDGITSTVFDLGFGSSIFGSEPPLMSSTTTLTTSLTPLNPK